MILTGQCKEDFDKWFMKNKPEATARLYCPRIKIFEVLPLSMQYGVYVDLLDSVGIIINIRSNYDIWFNIIWHEEIDAGDDSFFDTRLQARKAAIEKANDLYNERN